MDRFCEKFKIKSHFRIKGKIGEQTTMLFKDPEENHLVVNKFLDKNRNYILEDSSNYINKNLVKDKCLNILPGESNLDGGFAAKLRKL